MMTENYRKCFKCGRSPAKENVKLFRFPKPGVKNLFRCKLWARYMIPEKLSESVESIEFYKKLYNEHRMLCQHHFDTEDFTDSTMQKLSRNSFPRDKTSSSTGPNLAEKSVLPGPSLAPLEPQPGHSRILSGDISNTLQASFVTPGPSSAPLDPQPGPSSVPARDLSNTMQASFVTPGPSSAPLEPQPGTSSVPARDLSNTMQPSFSTTQCLKKMKTNKEKMLYSKCARYMKRVCKLRNSVKKLKKKAVLNILSDDNSVKKLSKKITPTFALLLQAQIRNYKKKGCGHRWTREEKIVALRLYKRSPTCYRLLRRLFNLPSPGTLKLVLNRVPFYAGVSQAVLNVLKSYIKTLQPSDNEFILMFDEMSLKKHLEYDQKQDKINGYQDHGKQGRSSTVASYALVFMLAGIRKTIKQPIAYFFSSGFSTADRLAVLIKEVLHNCSQAGINVSATVCDMDGVNRRALTILGATSKKPSFKFENQEILSIFDVPHLLKCFRNNFMKYDVDCVAEITSENRTGRGIAKWSYIKEFHQLDNCNPNFVFAPGLTKDHLEPNTHQKMKVKLAAQVLSHTVAAGMFAKIADKALSTDAVITANVINKMDKLFDCVNSDTADLRRGKCCATNMTKNTPHLKIFAEMRRFFEEMRFIGAARKPPSQEGWIWTLNAIEKLFQMLNHKDVKSLATRRLQQDPLENLFGCIRGNCGSNTNPTCGQFLAGLKTTILSSMAHVGTTGNCEHDNNVVINNFSTLLSISKPTDISINPEYIDKNELQANVDNIFTIDEDGPEIQACAYVCGFLLKKKKLDCNSCTIIFVAENVEKQHLFVECREYDDYKKKLKYASKSIINCVESCATVANKYLEEKGHTQHLKENLLDYIKKVVNFDVMDMCPPHKVQNIKYIIDSVFSICIKRFCILKNRQFKDQASAAALKRKINILAHR